MSEPPQAQVSLEEVILQVETELHAWSNSKKLDFKDWTREEYQAIRANEADSLHPKGRLVTTMYALFLAKDRKLKQECLNTLAGVMFYAHKMLYEQNRSMGIELGDGKHQLQALRQKNLDLQAEYDKLEVRVSQLRKDARQSEELLQQTEDQLNQERTEGNNKLTDMVKELEEITRLTNSELSDRDNKIETLLQQVDQYREKIEEMRAIEETLVARQLQSQVQIDQDERDLEVLDARVKALEAQARAHRCAAHSDDDHEQLVELQETHAKCYPALSAQRNAAREFEREASQLTTSLYSSRSRVRGLEEKVQRLEGELRAAPDASGTIREIQTQLNALQMVHDQCTPIMTRLKQTLREVREEKERILHVNAARESEVDRHRETITHLHTELAAKDTECQLAAREAIFFRDQVARVRATRDSVSASQCSDVPLEEQTHRRPEPNFIRICDYDAHPNRDNIVFEAEADLPRPYRRQADPGARKEGRRNSSPSDEDSPRKGRQSNRPQEEPPNRMAPSKRYPVEPRRRASLQGRRERGGGDE